MIKVDRAIFEIRGTSFDLTFEFNSIITQMAKTCPEILCGVISERTDTISHAMATANLDMLNHFADLTKEYNNTRKEIDDEC